MPEKSFVVVSSIKTYVKKTSGLKCSDHCALALHKITQDAVDHARLRAEREGCKTLLLRHFDHLFVMDVVFQEIK